MQQDKLQQDETEALQAVEQLVREFAHEIRTPITSVLAWIRLVQSGKLNEEHFNTGLETIERNVKYQARLIEDLFEFVRLISGKKKLDCQVVDLNQIISEAIAAMSGEAQSKKIRIVRTMQDKVVNVSGDAAPLQRILVNLLSNAIKFSPQDGEVRIDLALSDSSVQVIVSDQGKGIDSEAAPFIFQAFQRPDLVGRQHGLGVGLAIAKGLVELHRGRIEAESKGPDQGATFRVTLPLLSA